MEENEDAPPPPTPPSSPPPSPSPTPPPPPPQRTSSRKPSPIIQPETTSIREPSERYSEFHFFDLDPLDGTDAEFEEALTATGYGKFNAHLLIYCGIIYGYSAIGVTSLSFIVPAAVNELDLTTSHKGLMLTMPIIGMVFGSYFWGITASTKGRWISLFSSLLLNGFCGILSIFMPDWASFTVIRFFTGFAVSSLMSICFPYLGEFTPIKHREKALIWLEFFWVVGIILLPGIAFLIIPLDVYANKGGFIFTSWKLYLIICALPNFFLALWLLAFPESPKFLVEHDEKEAALKALAKVFSVNKGQPASNYSIAGVKHSSIVSVHKIHSHLYVTTKKLRLYKIRELKLLLKAACRYTTRLFSMRYLKSTLLLLGIQCGLTCGYYVLMLWFPELFNRYKILKILQGNTDFSICETSKILYDKRKQVEEIQKHQAIYQDVFAETLYLGFSCLPLAIIFPFIIHKVGSKILLVIGLFLDAFAVYLIILARSEFQNLIISCVFKAIASITISLLYAITVDLYPAKLRVIAVAIGMTFGRIAALLGNVLMGYLIDQNCFIPFATFGTLLLCTIGAVLSVLLPNLQTKTFTHHPSPLKQKKSKKVRTSI